MALKETRDNKSSVAQYQIFALPGALHFFPFRVQTIRRQSAFRHLLQLSSLLGCIAYPTELFLGVCTSDRGQTHTCAQGLTAQDLPLLFRERAQAGCPCVLLDSDELKPLPHIYLTTARHIPPPYHRSKLVTT